MDRERVARSPWTLLVCLIVVALLFGAGRPSHGGELPFAEFLEELGLVHGFTWPAHPVVARAYMDQLARTNALPEAARSRLSAVLNAATPLVDGNRKSATVAKDLRAAATALDSSSAGENTQRIAALRNTLTQIADRIG